MKSCLAIFLTIILVVLIGVAGFYLYESNKNAEFEKKELDPSLFAE